MTELSSSIIVSDKSWGDSLYYDQFIVATGSDHRAYQSLRLANNHGVKIGSVIVFEFSERVESENMLVASGSAGYRTIPFPFHPIRCSLEKPASGVRQYLESDRSPSNYDKPLVIAVDVSCFTKPYYFGLLKALVNSDNVGRIVIVYTEPIYYKFTNGLYTRFSSSSGELKVERIPGYIGELGNRKQPLLIVQLGFDGEIANEVFEDVSPAKVVIVNGFPGYTPKQKDISLIANERLVEANRSHLQYCRANDPFESYNMLCTLREENADMSLIIAPLGPKPMALGACWFALKYPEVAVLYPVPDKHSDSISEESSDTWVYNVNMNNLP